MIIVWIVLYILLGNLCVIVMGGYDSDLDRAGQILGVLCWPFLAVAGMLWLLSYLIIAPFDLWTKWRGRS